MKLTRLVLIGSALLFACSPKIVVLPDPSVPHQVAEDAEVVILVRQPDGKMAPQKVAVAKGWWIASPAIIEPPVAAPKAP